MTELAKGANAAALSATEAANRIRSGRLTSQALVEACFARIDARDADVRAWVALDAERALDEARAADRFVVTHGAQACGPLHGIPIGVKDILDTAELPTAYGSPIYEGHRPIADAACVAHARAAGAIVLGKTATAEFASIHPPATRNPRKLEHGPGGSSSGSAAAVADAMVPLAFGTQTAGSTIRPAAFCGIVGYKPSFGLINRAGLKFSAESLDTIGLFARSVDDVALFMHAVSGQSRLPPRSTGRSAPWRIGLCRTPYWSRADSAAQEALQTSARRLALAGATVIEYELPHELPQEPTVAWDAHAIIIRHEAARAMAWETRVHRASYSPAFAARIDEGLSIDHASWRAANLQANDCRRRFASTIGAGATVDTLITPSAIGVAPLGNASTGDSLFNRNWTLLGVPCVHLPTGTDSGGLPIGVQVVGAFAQDIDLLECARWIEEALHRE